MYNKYTYLSSIKLVTYIVHLGVSGEMVLLLFMSDELVLQLLTFVIRGS